MSEPREISDAAPDDDARDTLERILATEEAHAGLRVFGGRAEALQDDATALGGDRDGDQFDRE